MIQLPPVQKKIIQIQVLDFGLTFQIEQNQSECELTKCIEVCPHRILHSYLIPKSAIIKNKVIKSSLLEKLDYFIVNVLDDTQCYDLRDDKQIIVINGQLDAKTTKYIMQVAQ